MIPLQLGNFSSHPHFKGSHQDQKFLFRLKPSVSYWTSREEYKNRTSMNVISPNIHPGTSFQLQRLPEPGIMSTCLAKLLWISLPELAQSPLRSIQNFSIQHSFSKINYPLHKIHIFLFVLNLAPTNFIWFPLALGQDTVNSVNNWALSALYIIL